MKAADFTTPDEVINVYRRRARNYDITANLYYLIGLREFAYRRRAAGALRLRPGDTVVEIGCGTGLNFSLLEERVGPSGRVIGVDITDAMLEKARERVARKEWGNCELALSAAADYRIPEGVDAVLSTFALTLEPEYDRVVAQTAKALRPGGRFVLLDLKLPANWLRHFVPLLVLLARPFAVSLEVAKRRPWESMRRYLKNVTMKDLYLGVVYLAVGEV